MQHNDEIGHATRSPGTGAAAPAKADLTKRVIAAVIDAVIGGVVSIIPVVGGLVAAAYWLCRDGLDIEFMDRRSLGKKVMKLRPVTQDGAPMDLVRSLRRNWMFGIGGIVSLLMFIPIVGWLLIIPVALVALGLGVMEIFLVVTDPKGQRLGDRTASTQVIEVAD
jgi:uncharacterized RDD family membrane protein YckC